MKSISKYNRPYLLTLLLVMYFLAIEALSVSPTSDLLIQSPWTNMETWEDWDGDGTFILKNMPCENDNNWIFQPDSTFALLEDSIKCDPELPLDTIETIWYLQQHETMLTLSFAEGGQINFEIHSLGQHELILDVMEEDDLNGPTRQRVKLFR